MKKIYRMVVSRLAGILIFLLVLFVAGLIVEFFYLDFVEPFIAFFWDSAVLLIAITLLFLLGDVLSTLDKPLNLLFPVFNAAGGVLIVRFVLNMLLVVSDTLGLGLEPVVSVLAWILYPLLFIILLLTGLLEALKKK